MLIIKRISWWPWTRVSTLAFKEPPSQVRTMTHFLRSTIISGIVCLFQVTTTVNPCTSAPLSDLKNLQLHDLCVPQLLLYYYHYYHKVATTVILLQLLLREENWRKTIKIEMRGVLSTTSSPQKQFCGCDHVTKIHREWKNRLWA